MVGLILKQILKFILTFSLTRFKKIKDCMKKQNALYCVTKMSKNLFKLGKMIADSIFVLHYKKKTTLISMKNNSKLG